MIVQQRSGCGCVGCVLIFLLIMTLFGGVAVVALFVGAAIYAIYKIVLWLITPQSRLFGAFPMSRWSNAYEHGLFLLESRFGVLTNTNPTRIFISVATLTLTPLILLNIMFPIFSPIVLGVIYLTGLGVSFATTNTLVQPYAWFKSDVYLEVGLEDLMSDYAQDELLDWDKW